MKKTIFIIFILFLVGIATSIFLRTYKQPNWRDLKRDSAKISDPNFQEDTVQVFAARTYGWRGVFAVHSWISYKKAKEEKYTVIEVVGWRARKGLPVVRKKFDIPDRYWFGNKPKLIDQVVGNKASNAIKKIELLTNQYSDRDRYVLWPGPNSNTFISHLIRNTKELTNSLPTNAIGKDWIHKDQFLTNPASGRGIHISLYGVLGFAFDLKNGIEFNILSLNFGIDLLCPAIKLPFIDRLGFEKSQCF